MEVSGRKVFNEHNNLLCKPCEESGLSTRVDGLCRECKEHMCKPCFDTHKKYKLNRGHTLTNSDETVAEEEQAEDFERCDQHSSEMIKFYCPLHEQVGCGDCMILEHKTCKVEYIRDKARMFTDSQEFKTLVKGAQKYRIAAQEMTTSIKNNKKQVVDVNEKFNQDVNLFKEEMIWHINKLTDAMLKQGEHIKANNIKSMEELENENKIITLKISRLTETFESQTKQPQKLFVSSILQKPKLSQLREQLDSMQARNKIEIYEFQRNNNLEDSVKDGKQLGSIQRVKSRNEIDVQEEVEVPAPLKPKTSHSKPRIEFPPWFLPQHSGRDQPHSQHTSQPGHISPQPVPEQIRHGQGPPPHWGQYPLSHIPPHQSIGYHLVSKDVQEEVRAKKRNALAQVPVATESQTSHSTTYSEVLKKYSSRDQPHTQHTCQPGHISPQPMPEQMRHGQRPPSPPWGQHPWSPLPPHPFMGCRLDMQSMPEYPGVRLSRTDSHSSGTDSQEEA